ncbi:MAG: DUF3800 domain-containing protein [Muricauda sp.]|nr:DUF3800 domain-containing protein [Allomuricauda sp.]MBO6533290.1 DUF3800 domain-containing protein [Allomuricauda sp.]MBO6589335.1 DUF3800 domain-containing protein [Allomuricauda sp.]MBO6618960.1 DUF3800 domain-containing protein [Allomuricauda sp.]MBO6644872.1 DUF3800 domain-containing protein [Allomuricauda sp.]MBO6746773.1 DUF3800 domain-containing protein [Allomuricauda sp.]
MKFCYIDESGTGNEPVAVMVGILVDAYRMKPTKAGWEERFNYLTNGLGLNIEELHAKDLFQNRKAWRILEGETKSEIVDEFINWFSTRGHSIVYSTVIKDEYQKLSENDLRLQEIGTLWRFLGTHLLLSVQKSMSSKKNNKGNTVFIFDNKETDKTHFTDLVLSAPEWTDSYYNKRRKEERFSQIIDVPHFVDSKNVGLIQLADLFAYIFRRHYEIAGGFIPEKFAGEGERMKKWHSTLMGLTIPKSAIYPKQKLCDTARLIIGLAPDCAK